MKMSKQVGRILIIVVGLAIVACLGYIGFFIRSWYGVTHNPSPSISSNTVTYSTTTPDETVLGEICTNYQVADQQPRRIVIESIGVDACIEKVGVDQENRVAVPTNIHLAGWYAGSVLPGEEGLSLIDGHVLGRYNDAVFKNLDQLKDQDRIKIEFGDRSWREFEVYFNETFDLETTQREYLKQTAGVEAQLTLITCGGTFDSYRQQYDQRVVVRSALIESR